MSAPPAIHWKEMLVPDTSLLEIFLRGSLMYICLFLLLRFILKRQSGTVALADLLLLVLIADAAQNGMAGNYHSVPDGVLLVATLIFWNFFLDWLGYRFRPVQRLVHPPPLQLVKDGQMLRRNMQKELVTRDELMSQLREQGVQDVSEVREAYIEGDGRISIVRYGCESAGGARPRRGES